MTMPQRQYAPAVARPGVPGPRPMGRPMAAAVARPIPAAHPAAMPVGRPAVPQPRAAVTFLTVAEVAAMMRVSKMTVYRLVHAGELSAVLFRPQHERLVSVCDAQRLDPRGVVVDEPVRMRFDKCAPARVVGAELREPHVTRPRRDESR